MLRIQGKEGMFSMEMAKVTSKGQITIPVSIRKRLNINEGDKLLFIDRPDGVMMVNPNLLQPERFDDLSAILVASGEDQPENKAAISPANPEVPVSRSNGFDVAVLLNEIRSMGSKI